MVYLAAVIGAGDGKSTMEVRRAVEGKLPAPPCKGEKRHKEIAASFVVLGETGERKGVSVGEACSGRRRSSKTFLLPSFLPTFAAMSSAARNLHRV